MGNKISNVCEYLYIIKVRNPALPLCPFIHCIVSYNSIPIKNTDPAVFKNILSKSNLILEIMDLRNLNKFFITIPKGMEKLGLNVIKLKKIPNILRIMVINVKENAVLRKDDRILGIENLYLSSEDDLIDYIKNNIGETINMVIIRNNNVITEEIILTNDLGCELGIGILYNLENTIYYNKEYNREIKISNLENKNNNEYIKISDNQLESLSNKDINLDNVNIKQNDVNVNLDNVDIKESDVNVNLDNVDIKESLSNKDINLDNVDIKESDVNVNLDNVDIKGSDVNVNQSNSIKIDNNMKTEVEEKKKKYYNDSDSITLSEREELFLKNKITSDKYFLKETKSDKEKDGIVMIGNDLVNKNDFVENENGFQMKEKIFEKLKNAHEKSLNISESKDDKFKSDDLKDFKINGKNNNSNIDDKFINNEKSITNLFSDDEEFSFNNLDI